MFHPSIAKAAVAPPLWPRRPEEATRILQACVVAWPGVACHGGVLAEGSNPKPKPPTPWVSLRDAWAGMRGEVGRV